MVKLHSGFLTKHHSGSLRRILAVFFLLLLVGCSGGAEIERLQSENEKLQAELNEAAANLETAASKIEALEAEVRAAEEKLSVVPKAQAEPPKAAAVQADIVPNQLSAKELLIGEWYFPLFHDEYIYSWAQSLVFNANGSGKTIRTFYMPKDIEGYSTSDPSGEVVLEFSWRLDGNAVHTEYADNKGFVDFTFSPEQQKLFINNENGEERNGKSYYAREKTPIPENYIEKSVFLGNMQSKESALMRNFLGSWYFDVLIWTFYEDGTGTVDIPKLGDNPATTREFSYSVTGDDTNLMMTLDWSEEQTAYFWPVINLDGSITLRGAGDSEVMTLTRSFDASNCPITAAIISTEISVISGSIFNDMLGIS